MCGSDGDLSFVPCGGRQWYDQQNVNFVNNNGDDKVHKFYYSKQYHNGCGEHPDLIAHQQ